LLEQLRKEKDALDAKLNGSIEVKLSKRSTELDFDAY